MAPLFATDSSRRLRRPSAAVSSPRQRDASTQSHNASAKIRATVFFFLASGAALAGLLPHYARLHQPNAQEAALALVKSSAERAHLSIVNLPHAEQAALVKVRAATEDTRIAITDTISARGAMNAQLEGLEHSADAAFQGDELTTNAIGLNCEGVESHGNAELHATRRVLESLQHQKSALTSAQALVDNIGRGEGRSPLDMARRMSERALAWLGWHEGRSQQMRLWRAPITAALIQIDVLMDGTDQIIKHLVRRQTDIAQLCGRAKTVDSRARLDALKESLHAIRGGGFVDFNRPRLLD